MHDQGIPTRTALGGEDPGDCCRIQRIRAQAVDRLGGKGHRSAGFQQLDRPRHAGGRADAPRTSGVPSSKPPTALRLRTHSGRSLENVAPFSSYRCCLTGIPHRGTLPSAGSGRKNTATLLYTLPMQSAEIELKFPIDDLASSPSAASFPRLSTRHSSHLRTEHALRHTWPVASAVETDSCACAATATSGP